MQNNTRIGTLALSGVVFVGAFAAYACSTTRSESEHGDGGTTGGSTTARRKFRYQRHWGQFDQLRGYVQRKHGRRRQRRLHGLRCPPLRRNSRGLLDSHGQRRWRILLRSLQRARRRDTFFFSRAGAGGPLTIYDAGPDGCAIYCGCDTNVAPSSLTTGNSTPALSLVGDVVTYSGFGTWLYKCVDASQYSGIQLTVSGSTNDLGPDGGANRQIQVQVTELENWSVASAGGTCLAADGGPGDMTMCQPATATVNLPSTGMVEVPWSAFTGGAPKKSIDDPGATSCRSRCSSPGTTARQAPPYMPNISTISNIGFYQ